MKNNIKKQQSWNDWIQLDLTHILIQWVFFFVPCHLENPSLVELWLLASSSKWVARTMNWQWPTNTVNKLVASRACICMEVAPITTTTTSTSPSLSSQWASYYLHNTRRVYMEVWSLQSPDSPASNDHHSPVNWLILWLSMPWNLPIEKQMSLFSCCLSTFNNGWWVVLKNEVCGGHHFSQLQMVRPTTSQFLD